MRTVAAVLVAAVCAAASLGAARGAERVEVPGFIDPHRHVDPPDLGRGRVIRFLTTDDDPPFSYLATDGTLTGYNVDLARAVCTTLQVSCSVQARSFESLIAALNADAGDAVIASLAVTARSRAQVDFSLPTIRMAARFAARADAVPDAVLPDTVAHLVVGVQAGTAQEAYLRRFFPLAVVRTFTDPESLRAALRERHVDLMFADGLATALWLNGSTSAGCCRFAGGPFTESAYFGEGSAIAVRKGDAQLREAFDAALQRLSGNGTMADLYLKYFPLGFF